MIHIGRGVTSALKVSRVYMHQANILAVVCRQFARPLYHVLGSSYNTLRTPVLLPSIPSGLGIGAVATEVATEAATSCLLPILRRVPSPLQWRRRLAFAPRRLVCHRRRRKTRKLGMRL